MNVTEKFENQAFRLGEMALRHETGNVTQSQASDLAGIVDWLAWAGVKSRPDWVVDPIQELYDDFWSSHNAPNREFDEYIHVLKGIEKRLADAFRS